MHRTLRRPWFVLGGMLLALLQVGLTPGVGWAQVCTPQTKPLVVTLNGTVRLRMASKKAIRTVLNPKEGVVTIRTIDRDPTMIVLAGTAPGITRLELEDSDGARETYEVHVQADVEYLRSQLRLTLPLNNIQIIPNGTNSVVLLGYVSRVEEIQMATAIARGIGFEVIAGGLRTSGVQQVQLDVVVARVARGKTRDFGFNFLQNSRNQLFGSTIGGIIPQPATIGATGITPTRFGQTLASSPGAANLFGGILGPNSGFLGFLQALEQENLAKLLAQPRLTTLSGNPASFLDGGEQAVPIPAGLGQVGVQFEEFGTRLNFLPIVLGGGKIHLEVEPEVSILSNAGSVTLVAGGQPVQGRQTQRVHTTVEMESGQTFVIGGLIQHQVDASTTKVPVLGQLPFIGAAFSTKQFVESETELVIMVTPYLVDPQSCDQVAKVLPGQESRSPDDFELFLEGLIESPRGKREVFVGHRYVPAHKYGPTANLFPCYLDGGCNGAEGGCASGACAASTKLTPPAPIATSGTPAPTPVPAGTASIPDASAAPTALAPVPSAPMPVTTMKPLEVRPVAPLAPLPPPPASRSAQPLGGDLSAETPTREESRPVTLPRFGGER